MGAAATDTAAILTVGPGAGDPNARNNPRVRSLGRLLLAVVIVLGTGAAIRHIAIAKNEAMAGGGAYALGPDRGAAWAGWEHLLAHVRKAGATTLLGELESLQRGGRIWVAPRLPKEQRAIWVRTLGLVDRVYVAERELTWSPAALQPGLRVPPLHLDAFAWVSLSGTLVHEMAHARGVATESSAYDLEILWLETIANLPGIVALPPPEREATAWAIRAAVDNARRARAIEAGRSD